MKFAKFLLGVGVAFLFAAFFWQTSQLGQLNENIEKLTDVVEHGTLDTYDAPSGSAPSFNFTVTNTVARVQPPTGRTRYEEIFCQSKSATVVFFGDDDVTDDAGFPLSTGSTDIPRLGWRTRNLWAVVEAADAGPTAADVPQAVTVLIKCTILR